MIYLFLVDFGRGYFNFIMFIDLFVVMCLFVVIIGIFKVFGWVEDLFIKEIVFFWF